MRQTNEAAVEVLDLGPDGRAFLEDARAGLSRAQKSLPCKYLYDSRGAALFDEICELEEYYPTRTELGILVADGGELSRLIGPRCLLVELGSGSGRKTRLLLDRLESPAAYVPVDVSGAQLEQTAAIMRRAYPRLRVHPVCADFTGPLELPPLPASERTVVFFPGSTIGNLHPIAAARFLGRLARLCGPGGGMVLGVDLDKDPETLDRAYNDAQGVTAAFNLNLLTRMNRELGADFDVSSFRHLAFYDTALRRIEMHLVSTREQVVHLGPTELVFGEAETIHTECSYKYDLDGVREIAASGGFELQRAFVDPQRLFAVCYLTVSAL